jgi:hypothetical protein
VQCRRRSARIELAVPANRVRRRQGLNLDAVAFKLPDRIGIGAHAPVRAGTYEQMFRKILTDVIEIVEHESVSVCAPPVCDDTIGQHDQVPRLFFAVHNEAAEAIALELGNFYIQRYCEIDDAMLIVAKGTSHRHQRNRYLRYARTSVTQRATADSIQCIGRFGTSGSRLPGVPRLLRTT